MPHLGRPPTPVALTPPQVGPSNDAQAAVLL